MKNDDFKFEIERQSNILIKAENKEQKQRAIIMLLVLTATFIVTILSLVFSIKSYKNTKKETKEEIEQSETYYQTLSTIFSDKDTINIEKLTAGYISEPKTITITNEGDTAIEYNIKIVSITTNLLSTNSLMYNLSNNLGISINKELPLQEATILANEKIEPEQTKEYTFTIIME